MTLFVIILKVTTLNMTVLLFSVDGEKLKMKGAKLTSLEMLSALQTRCNAKDPQSKATGKK